MLVITRRVGERIQIGDDITATVVRIVGNSVRLGIDAPSSLTVVRDELADPNRKLGEGRHSEPVEPTASR